MADIDPPIISLFRGCRCNSDGSSNDNGTYMKISINASITASEGNTMECVVEYKLYTANAWTNIDTIKTGTSCSKSYIIAADANHSYDLRATVTDINTNTVATALVPTAFSLIDINSSGYGIAFGKASEADLFECAMPAIFSESLMIGDVSFDEIRAKIYDEVYLTSASPTFANYPAFDWCVPIYPSDNLVMGNDGIPFTYTDAEYGNHLGTFINMNNQTVYRLKKINNTIQFADVSNTPEGFTIKASNDTNSALNDTNSALADTNTEVSKKCDTTKVITVINQSADQINITGDRIKIQSTYFVLDYDGNVTCQNLKATNADISGKVTATSGEFTGKVTSSEGSVGGWSMNNSSLYCVNGAYEFIMSNTPLYGNTSFHGGLANALHHNGSALTYGVYWDGSIYTKDIMSMGNLQVLGTSEFTGTVYNSSGGTVFTSDEHAKHDIESLDIEKSAEFIYSLNPVSYKFNNNESGRNHHGLIAQEVKSSMGDDDWGLYIDRKYSMEEPTLDDDGNVLKEDGTINPTKGLRYDELIADLVATVQLQNQRIKELEDKMKGE